MDFVLSSIFAQHVTFIYICKAEIKKLKTWLVHKLIFSTESKRVGTLQHSHFCKKFCKIFVFSISALHITIKVFCYASNDARTESITQTNHSLKNQPFLQTMAQKQPNKYPIKSQIFNFSISALHMSVKSICYASIEMRTKFITKSNHSLKKISLFFKKSTP